jgi:type II secretory pathway component PulM
MSEKQSSDNKVAPPPRPPMERKLLLVLSLVLVAVWLVYLLVAPSPDTVSSPEANQQQNHVSDSTLPN